MLESMFEKVVIFSDRYAAQYKSKQLFLGQFPWTIVHRKVRFGSRHGQSVCDACGGVIKRVADEDILFRECIIQNAQAMFKHYCDSYVLPLPDASADQCCHTKRSFHIIKTQDRRHQSFMKSSSIATVSGTRQLHCMTKLRKKNLATRNLIYVWPPCMGENASQCINKTCVGPWKSVTLNVAETVSMAEDGAEEQAAR